MQCTFQRYMFCTPRYKILVQKDIMNFTLVLMAPHALEHCPRLYSSNSVQCPQRVRQLIITDIRVDVTEQI